MILLKNDLESSVLQSLLNPANIPDHKVLRLLTYCARQQLLKSKDFISLKKKKSLIQQGAKNPIKVNRWLNFLGEEFCEICDFQQKYDCGKPQEL